MSEPNKEEEDKYAQQASSFAEIVANDELDTDALRGALRALGWGTLNALKGRELEALKDRMGWEAANNQKATLAPLLFEFCYPADQDVSEPANRQTGQKVSEVGPLAAVRAPALSGGGKAALVSTRSMLPGGGGNSSPSARGASATTESAAVTALQSQMAEMREAIGQLLASNSPPVQPVASTLTEFERTGTRARQAMEQSGLTGPPVASWRGHSQPGPQGVAGGFGRPPLQTGVAPPSVQLPQGAFYPPYFVDDYDFRGSNSASFYANYGTPFGAAPMTHMPNGQPLLRRVHAGEGSEYTAGEFDQQTRSRFPSYVARVGAWPQRPQTQPRREGITLATFFDLWHEKRYDDAYEVLSRRFQALEVFHDQNTWDRARFMESALTSSGVMNPTQMRTLMKWAQVRERFESGTPSESSEVKEVKEGTNRGPSNGRR